MFKSDRHSNGFFKDLKLKDFILDMGLDLKCILSLMVIAIGLIYIPGINGTVARAIFSFAAVMLAPGYSCIAALFPGRSDIRGFERMVLSICFSIVTISLIGFLLDFTPWGIHLDQVIACAATFTILCTMVANKRRHVLREEDRFAMRLTEISSYLLSLAFPRVKSPVDQALSLLLVLSMVAAAGVLTYAITEPEHGEMFTELYLLGADHQADHYPTTYQLGESRPIIVGVTNHEGRDMDYSLVVLLNNTTRSSSLYLFPIKLSDNQTWEGTMNLKPDIAGDNLKMTFLLYADGNITAPYRECHIWINVMP